MTRDERYLGIRTFTDSIKQKVYEKQKGHCPILKNIMTFPKWKVTTSHHGTKEAKQSKSIAKCSAKTITEENQENKNKVIQ